MVPTLKSILLTLLVAVAVLSVVISVAKADPSPGISVTIMDMDPFITSPSDAATYTVNAESITTEDENVKLTVSGDPNLNFD